MSTLNVNTVKAATLDTVTSIKNSASTTVLTTNTSEPLLFVGNGANTIKARNTAKWWISCNGFSSILSSYGIASIADSGSNTIAINFSTATSGGYYAAATSVSHAAGLSWNAIMNNSGAPSSTSTNYRFTYSDGGGGYNPFAWSAIGFGDQ
jgi:hypothetical protein